MPLSWSERIWLKIPVIATVIAFLFALAITYAITGTLVWLVAKVVFLWLA